MPLRPLVAGMSKDTAATSGSGNVPTGGLTGEVLSKQSNTDFDLVWISIPPGTATEWFTYTSSGSPSGTVVANQTGDLCLNSIGDIYKANAPGTLNWSSAGINIKGADGTNGSNGTDGTNGSNGTNGTDGVGVPSGGTTNTILAKIDDTSYNTQWISISTFFDSLSSTQGDIFVRDSSGWTALASGTIGYVLTSTGPASTPSWQAVSGGGGSPGGANTYIQYNNSGAFGGTADLAVDIASHRLIAFRGIRSADTYAFRVEGLSGTGISLGNGGLITDEAVIGGLQGGAMINLSRDGGFASDATFQFVGSGLGYGGGRIELGSVTAIGTPASGTGRIAVVAGEVNVADSSGNVSVISPHAKDAPDSLYRIAPGVDQMRRHANPYRGIVQYVAEDGREAWETFAERNARRPDLEPLVFADWDAVEAERVVTREAEIAAWHTKADAAAVTRAAWLAADPATRGPEPAFSDPQPQPYVAQARPEWARQVTREQLDAIVPVSVLAHQLRVQLIHEGIEPDNVTAAIAQIPDATAKKLASIEWEYAPTIRREHPLVSSLASVFHLSTEQVDDIFRKAAKL